MTALLVTPGHIRRALLLREEIALLDLRHETAYATGHPLFAANMAADRIELKAEIRLPRKDVPIVVYVAGEGLVAQAADRLAAGSSARCPPLSSNFAAAMSNAAAACQNVTNVGLRRAASRLPI